MLFSVIDVAALCGLDRKYPLQWLKIVLITFLLAWAARLTPLFRKHFAEYS